MAVERRYYSLQMYYALARVKNAIHMQNPLPDCAWASRVISLSVIILVAYMLTSVVQCFHAVRAVSGGAESPPVTPGK